MEANKLKIGNVVRLPNELTGNIVHIDKPFVSPMTGHTFDDVNVRVKALGLDGMMREYDCAASMLRPSVGPEAAPPCVEEVV